MKPNEGFAKLKGYDVEFYLQKLTVTLGRTTSEHKSLLANYTKAQTPGSSAVTTSAPVKQKVFPPEVDIPLGEYRNVSRVHAKIQFNFKKKAFELVPLGKNGVRVDGKFYARGSDPVAMKNGSEVQLGDAFFVFLLPQTPTTVKKIAPLDVDESQYRIQEGRAGTSSSQLDRRDTMSPGRSRLQAERDPNKSYEKPTESYAVIISRALLKRPDKQLTLQDIYQHILDKFPYFQTSEVGWKSSVRHALSTNKFFKRVPLDNGGKRAIYALDDDYEDEMREVHEAAERKKREREQRLLAQKETKKRKAMREEREGKRQKFDPRARQMQHMQYQQHQQQLVARFTQCAQQLHMMGVDHQILQQYQLQFMAYPEQTLQHMLHQILQFQQQHQQQQQNPKQTQQGGVVSNNVFGTENPSALNDVVRSLQQQVNTTSSTLSKEGEKTPMPSETKE